MDMHHVAYAVRDVAASAKAFEALGYEAEAGPVLDEGRNVVIQFVRQPGGLRVELVAPAGDGSPVSRLLEKERGASAPYHICYEVDDIDEALGRLGRQGFVVTRRSEPAPAIGGRNVAFAFSAAAGLVELLERGGR